MQYVVFGADGYLGSFLYRQLVKNGFNVIGTSRRLTNENNLLFYDIQISGIDNILSKMNDKDRTAIICVAEPRIDSCYENYSQAYDVNVIKTKELIHKLSKEGFRIIYFSSDNVFDGMEGNYTEESSINPINKYGMMKAEMEKHILLYHWDACILRIPKVVSTQKAKQNVFTEWLNQKEIGSCKCIRGNRISFVCIEDIYQVCLLVAEKRLYGLYNIVGDNSFTRAELARKFYSELGASEIDIKECDLAEFEFKDNRPLDVSMSNLKFKKETGYRFMSMDSAINIFLTNL